MPGSNLIKSLHRPTRRICYIFLLADRVSVYFFIITSISTPSHHPNNLRHDLHPSRQPTDPTRASRPLPLPIELNYTARESLGKSFYTSSAQISKQSMRLHPLPRTSILTTPSDGQAWKVRARLQDDQVRHDTHPLELQPLPLWPALVHLRVLKVQIQVLPTMHSKGVVEVCLPKMV